MNQSQILKEKHENGIILKYLINELKQRIENILQVYLKRAIRTKKLEIISNDKAEKKLNENKWY